jgi:ABC-type ATPase involved in cell division
LLGILRERVDDGAALIAATHDERLVADIADRRIALLGGRVAADAGLVPAAAPAPS